MTGLVVDASVGAAWFLPDEASFWDDWYAKHNDFDYIQSVMLDEHRGGITKR